MIKKLRRASVLFSALLITGHCLAQPFIEDIQEFRKQDLSHPPPSGAILFVGSSSFTKWKDVSDYFPGYTIINRGFGGSTLPDLIRYTDDIIVPYHPKQVVIYCGDNDLASSDAITPDSVFERFKVLFDLIRSKLPGENIVYISIKPSPSRARLKTRMDQANLLIKTFLSINHNTAFVDVYHQMLKPDGSPISSIFLDDSLHMNASGYAIWQKAIKPYLSK